MLSARLETGYDSANLDWPHLALHSMCMETSEPRISRRACATKTRLEDRHEPRDKQRKFGPHFSQCANTQWLAAKAGRRRSVEAGLRSRENGSDLGEHVSAA